MSSSLKSLIAVGGCIVAGASMALLYAHSMYRKELNSLRHVRGERKAALKPAKSALALEVVDEKAEAAGKAVEAKGGPGSPGPASKPLVEMSAASAVPGGTISEMDEAELLAKLEESIGYINDFADVKRTKELQLYKRLRNIDMQKQSAALRVVSGKFLTAFTTMRLQKALAEHKTPKDYKQEFKRAWALLELNEEEEKEFGEPILRELAFMRVEVANHIEDAQMLLRSFRRAAAVPGLQFDDMVVLLPIAAVLGKWDAVRSFGSTVAQEPESLKQFHYISERMTNVPDMMVLYELAEAKHELTATDAAEDNIAYEEFNLVSLGMDMVFAHASDPENDKALKDDVSKFEKRPLRVFKVGERVVSRRGALVQMASLCPAPIHVIGPYDGADRLELRAFTELRGGANPIVHREAYSLTREGPEDAEGKSTWKGLLKLVQGPEEEGTETKLEFHFDLNLVLLRSGRAQAESAKAGKPGARRQTSGAGDEVKAPADAGSAAAGAASAAKSPAAMPIAQPAETASTGEGVEALSGTADNEAEGDGQPAAGVPAEGGEGVRSRLSDVD